MKFFKRVLGNREEPRQGVPSQPEGQDDSRLNEIGTQAATRRQLIRVVVRDTLRYCGIPENWIDCQITVMTRRTGVAQLHPRLIVRHWDDRLMRYLQVFEQRLLSEVQQFEPQAAEWLQPVTWQFKADDCPYTEMPEPATWTAVPEPAVSLPLLDAEPEAHPGDDVQADLARLFAVRDSALAELRSGDPGAVDFAKTQPGVA